MAVSDEKPKKILDARGLLCPMPVLKTNQAIKELLIGEFLEVLATDPGSKPDLTSWAKMTGNEIIKISEEDSPSKVFRFQIRRWR